MTEDEMVGWHHRLNGHETLKILNECLPLSSTTRNHMKAENIFLVSILSSTPRAVSGRVNAQ